MQNGVTSQSNSPLVTVDARCGGWTIIAVNNEAAALSLYPGLALADARALVSGLKSQEVDPVADHKALNALADSCARFTPYFAVEGDPSGTLAGLLLDISGCENLFGGEEELLDKLSSYLEKMSYSYRLAVADTLGAAWGMARFGDSVRTNVQPGAQQTALAPLSVAALRLSSAAVEGLQRLGIRTVGDLNDIARGPLVARFGVNVLKRLDQALGRRFEAITPQRPVPVYSVRLSFAEPIVHQNAINAALDKLLEDLCGQLKAFHKGARSVLLVGFRTDGTLVKLRVGTARPVCDPLHIGRLFREKLDGFNPAYGIDVVMLVAEKTDRLIPSQVSLDVIRGKADDEIERNLGHLLDRLDNRLGASQVLRLQCKARHIPEYATKAISVSKTLVNDDFNSGVFMAGPQASRPLRLLLTPEIIQVMTPKSDHPPVLFRWRQRPYQVARAEGPERIAPEWWREDPSELFEGVKEARDYYRLEDEKGTLFWIFRKGVYRPGHVVHWYMHGFFA